MISSRPRKPPGAKKPIRRPTQARGIATVEALLEAAARILSKEDFEAFTTNRVAKVAGVGIGSLYEYFPDKHELLAALTERFAAELQATLVRTLEAQDGVPIGQALANGLGVAVQLYLSRAELHRKLLGQVHHLPRTNPLDLVEEPIRVAMAEMLSRHADEIIVEDIEIAAINLCRICRGMVESAHADPFMPLDLAEVEHELVIVCRRYLTGRP